MPSEAPKSAADAMQSHYAETYRDLHARHWWWRAREDHVDHYMRRFVAPNSKILDVGCADGLSWDRWQDLGAIRGIEPDPTLVTKGSEIADRIEIAPFLKAETEGPFDALLMLDVLEHIEQEAEALQKVHSLLRPGGIYLLTVPALMMLWSDFDTLNGHYRRYTKTSLKKALQGAGFEIEVLRPFFLWSVLPLLLRRAFFRAENAAQSRFVQVPGARINASLLAWSRFENRLSRAIPWPLGSSILAVVRRS